MAILSTLSPWSALSDLQREMNQLMRSLRLGNGDAPESLQHTTRAWVPAVDVFSRDGDLVIRAELPGVDPEKDVDISVTDGVLTIRGRRRAEHRDEGTDYFRMETSYGSFARSIALPEGIKPDEITAVHRQGILEIVVPRAAQVPAAKKVPVQIEGRSGEKAITVESDGSAEAPAAAPAAGGEGDSHT